MKSTKDPIALGMISGFLGALCARQTLSSRARPQARQGRQGLPVLILSYAISSLCVLSVLGVSLLSRSAFRIPSSPFTLHSALRVPRSEFPAALVQADIV